MNVPDITKKISQLYSTLKVTDDSSEEIAHKINDILIWGEKIPQQLLAAAWDYYATKSGVKQ